MAGVNTALRAFVTGSQFNLSLRSSHIDFLVHCDLRDQWFEAWREALKRNPYNQQMPPFNPGSGPSTWYHATRGLERRGLIERGTDGGPYVLTEAGRLVVGLLKEAGIWQEYAASYVPDLPGSASAGAEGRR